MSSGKKKTKGEVAQHLRAAITGMRNHLAKQTLLINGERVQADDLIALFQSHLDMMQANDHARVTWRAGVATQRSELKSKIAPALAGLRDFLSVRFGPQAAELEELGYAPRKTAVRSSISKVIAIARSAATRKARNTRGKRQRLAIRGIVTQADLAQAFGVLSPPRAR